jgi:hypothetical protein
LRRRVCPKLLTRIGQRKFTSNPRNSIQPHEATFSCPARCIGSHRDERSVSIVVPEMEAPAPAPIPPGSGRGFLFFRLSWRDRINQCHGVIAARPRRRIASGLDTRRRLSDRLLHYSGEAGPRSPVQAAAYPLGVTQLVLTGPLSHTYEGVKRGEAGDNDRVRRQEFKLRYHQTQPVLHFCF